MVNPPQVNADSRIDVSSIPQPSPNTMPPIALSPSPLQTIGLHPYIGCTHPAVARTEVRTTGYACHPMPGAYDTGRSWSGFAINL